MLGNESHIAPLFLLGPVVQWRAASALSFALEFEFVVLLSTSAVEFDFGVVVVAAIRSFLAALNLILFLVGVGFFSFHFRSSELLSHRFNHTITTSIVLISDSRRDGLLSFFGCRLVSK